jgi:hypothetical protein
MSFQAYLDNIESKTGLTPRQFIDLGRGHAMALVHVITKGAKIDAKQQTPGVASAPWRWPRWPSNPHWLWPSNQAKGPDGQCQQGRFS